MEAYFTKINFDSAECRAVAQTLALMIPSHLDASSGFSLNLDNVLDKAALRFVMHVFITYPSADKQNKWGCPIPYYLIRKELGRLNEGVVAWLVDNKVIEKREGHYHKVGKGKCSEYRPSAEFYCCLKEVYQQLSNPLANRAKVPREVVRRKQKKTYFDGASNRNIPDLLYNSYRIINENGCPLNWRAMNQAIATRFSNNTMPKDFDERITRDMYPHHIGDAEFEQLLHILYGIESTADTYYPTFTPVRTGRSQEEGVGFQGAPRWLKKANFDEDPNIHNYDLVSCQPTVLLHQFNHYGIDCPWLSDYVLLPGIREQMASHAGIKVGSLKTAVLALAFGSELPKTCRDFSLEELCYVDDIKDSALPLLFYQDAAEHLEEGLYYDEQILDLADKYLRGFSSVIGNFPQNARKYRNLLMTKPQDNPLLIPIPNHPDQYKNLTGMSYKIPNKPTYGDKQFLFAFVLQGTEAAFIAHLTCLGLPYGYRVLSNQHDGIVTYGEIPTEALLDTTEYIGVPLKLAEKAFC